MRLGVSRMFACLVLAASAAGCASTNAASSAQAPDDASDTPSVTWETWPPREAVRAPVPPARVASAAMTIEPKPGGWRIDELFEKVHAATGVSILYDSGNATVKQAKVEFIGPFQVADNQLFAWLQAVLSYRKLVLVPVGPKGADGKQQWFVMDQADPNLKSRPVFIDESQVFDYAEHDGLYVVTTLRIRDMVDTTRIRNALSPLSTATAGIGRIQDIPGSKAIIVGDFAPVVAAMKQLLDRINDTATPPVARSAPVATPAAAPAAK